MRGAQGVDAELEAGLRSLFAGRRCIVVGGVFVGSHAVVRQLLNLGVDVPVLVICDAVGVGPVPDPAEAVPLVVDTRSLSTIDTIRQFEAAIADPDDRIRSVLDEFDPDCSALIVGSPFSTNETLDGRARIGLRKPEWARFEDKTCATDLLVDAGALPVPVAVVANDVGAMALAMDRIDQGSGVVVAGDTSSGHTGFSEYTRWVRDPAVLEAFAGCARVRVMPFVHGVPCSVHGMVLDDGVAVFRPVEMLTLVDDRDRFRFAGSATFWDPPAAGRHEMRVLARRVGEAMADTARYRGAFTLDGIMSEERFVATEINARWGGALGLVAGAVPELPLFVMDHAVRHGIPMPVSATDLEDAVVVAADRERRGAAYLSVKCAWDRGDVELTVSRDGREVPEGADWTWRLQAGGLRDGVHVRAVPNLSALEPGAAFAPQAVEGLALADRMVGTCTSSLRAQATLPGGPPANPR